MDSSRNQIEHTGIDLSSCCSPPRTVKEHEAAHRTPTISQTSLGLYKLFRYDECLPESTTMVNKDKHTSIDSLIRL